MGVAAILDGVNNRSVAYPTYGSPTSLKVLITAWAALSEIPCHPHQKKSLAKIDYRTDRSIQITNLTNSKPEPPSLFDPPQSPTLLSAVTSSSVWADDLLEPLTYPSVSPAAPRAA